MYPSERDQYLKVSAESLRPRKNGSGFQPRNDTRREWMCGCVFRRLSIPPNKNTWKPKHVEIAHFIASLTSSDHMLAASICLPSPRPAARLNLTWPRLQTCVSSQRHASRPTSTTPAQLASFRNFAHAPSRLTLTPSHPHPPPSPSHPRSFDRAALTALHLRAITAFRLDP
jgi:hypothetical protein